MPFGYAVNNNYEPHNSLLNPAEHASMTDFFDDPNANPIVSNETPLYYEGFDTNDDIGFSVLGHGTAHVQDMPTGQRFSGGESSGGAVSYHQFHIATSSLVLTHAS
jgi:hypothetical protein